MRNAIVCGIAVALLAFMPLGQSVCAAPPHFEGFEDANWVSGGNNWNDFGSATITRVVNGTNGIASSSGSAHGLLTVGNGPFTRFGGYSSAFNGGFIASLDVYLDPTWVTGTGFDYSVAASNQSGNHLRDFVWHVGVVADKGLLVNASNNTDSQFNSYKLINENSGNYCTLTTAGWYTLEQVFYENSGNLAVDFNLLNNEGAVYSVTRSTTDSIASAVGGNRYGWVTYNSIGGLAIDNTRLSALNTPAVPEPMSIMLGIMGLGSIAGFRKIRK